MATAPPAPGCVNNADWLAPIGLLEFLRDTGKHFTVNYMLQKESVKSRMESGISFTEFSYMLVQAYDFAHLAKAAATASCSWAAATSGGTSPPASSSPRGATGASCTAWSCPLLTTAAGAKFGKTEAGNVWLDPARTSPYAFHQFWLQTDDADVERMLKFMTFLDLGEIAELLRQHAKDPGQRMAQRRLADDVTERVHGRDAVRRAGEAAAILFGSGDLYRADAATLAVVVGEVPVTEITQDELDAGIPIADALHRSGLATSKAEARRGLAGAGFSVNGMVADGARVVTSADVLGGSVVLLRKGKRTWAALRVQREG